LMGDLQPLQEYGRIFSIPGEQYVDHRHDEAPCQRWDQWDEQ
jgi:hypothetical protein